MTKDRNEKWWMMSRNIVSWGCHGADNSEFLQYVDNIHADIIDRAVNYGRLSSIIKHSPNILEQGQFLKYRTTSFFSVDNWNISDLEPIMTELKKHIDVGFDGVHLDMLHYSTCINGKHEAITELVTNLKKYARLNFDRELMVAGNSWMLNNRWSIEILSICDVAWLETYGKSNIEISRICRTATGVVNSKKPVWIHWQPEIDIDNKVYNYENLPKMLFAAALFEGATFLCNYNYPVFNTRTIDQSSEFVGLRGFWSPLKINEEWRLAITEYSNFVFSNKSIYNQQVSAANTAIVSHVDDISSAGEIIDELILNNIQFDIIVYYDNRDKASIQIDDSRVYESLLFLTKYTTNKTDTNVFQLRDIEDEVLPLTKLIETADFKIHGDSDIIFRVCKCNNKTIIHFQNLEYSYETDFFIETKPCFIEYTGIETYASASIKCPENSGEEIPLITVDYNKWIIPEFDFYCMVILE